MISAAFINSVFKNIMICTSIMITSMVAHEFGHWVELRQHHKEAKILFGEIDGKIGLQTGEEHNYKDLTPSQRKKIYWAGVVVGSLPIVFAGYFSLGYLSLLGMYAILCKSDFEMIRRERTRRGKNG